MTSQRFNKTIERKKEIIKAAMQLFSEKGYAQTSMRDIAIVILLFYMILLLRLKIR